MSTNPKDSGLADTNGDISTSTETDGNATKSVPKVDDAPTRRRSLRPHRPVDILVPGEWHIENNIIYDTGLEFCLSYYVIHMCIYIK